MTCTGCGTVLGSGARFCSGCGRPLMVNSQPLYRSAQLVRPRENRMIAGVCAGFAQRYGWDLVIVRIVLLLSVLFAGVPLIAYVVAWIVMPNEQYALPAQVSQPLHPQPGAAQTNAGPGSIAM